MTFSYSAGASPRDTVRLLIADTNIGDVNAQIFQDEEVDVFLSLNNQSPLLAAAQGLDAMARNQLMLLKVITILDLQVDGARMAAELRTSAEKLREQYATGSGDETGMFDYAEMVLDPFGWRERILNQALRGAL